jgi:NAD(P)-dependent dehydrogenase (short-subunit alcohol dehydrogenase family)
MTSDTDSGSGDAPVAIVTGAAGGIGRAYCLGFARQGYAVVAGDIQDTEGTVKEVVTAGGRALGCAIDVTSDASAAEIARLAQREFGRIDVLVNNAAFYLSATQGPFDDITPAEWDLIFDVNVRGPWVCAKAVHPFMAAQGSGSIVNVSSTTVWDGTPDFVHYVASKAAAIGFSRALAREIGADGIRVNTVTPDYTPHDADFVARQADDLDAIITSRRCFPRSQRPEDMVSIVLFLAGDGSAAITGQNFLVNGGGVFQ